MMKEWLTYEKQSAFVKHLSLDSCLKLTDEGVAHLRGLSTLQYLSLHFCSQLTNEGVAHLRGLSALQYLRLTGCFLTH